MVSTPPDDLLDEPADAAALATVLARADAGDGTVTWARVSDELTTEQWGRLLARGVLVPAGDAFVLEDPPAVREALADRGVEVPPTDATAVGPDAVDPDAREESTAGPEAGGWSRADKAAGVSALALVAGYQVTPIKTAVAGAVDLLLGPLAAAAPFPGLVLALAVVTGVVTTVVQYRLRDTDALEVHQERLKDVRDRLEAARERGDDEAVQRLETRQQELMGQQLRAFADGLRPMVWTMLLTVPVFLWLSWLVVAPAQAIAPTATVFPMLGRVVWTARVVGPMQAWMVWYVGWSLVTSVTARRTLPRIEARLPA